MRDINLIIESEEPDKHSLQEYKSIINMQEIKILLNSVYACCREETSNQDG